MIRALFFDVDGTLLSFKTHRVGDSTRAALLEARARGVKLFVATGRTVSDLEPLAGIPFDGYVALNGSRCVGADGQVVSRHPIPADVFARALETAEELDFPVSLELEEGIFVDRVTPAVEQLAAMIAHPVPPVADLRALFARAECCQMCFYIDPATEMRVMERLPELSANRWSPIFADINVRGVDKATGMLEFLERCDLTAAEAMAFGDGGNDAPMLRAAGVGVAMGNGCREALEAADYVTASVDDDGIRKALVQFEVIDICH